MSKKSTHSGTCQACFRLHKLPGGVLALHGYKVESGFFSGSCRGSGHAPYQESCELVNKIRDEALEEALRLRAKSVEAAKPRQDKAYVTLYTTPDNPLHRFGFSKALKYLTPVIKKSRVGGTIVHFEADGYETYFEFSSDPQKVIDAHNLRHGYHIHREAERFERYAAYAQRNIDRWKPAPLIPNADTMLKALAKQAKAETRDFIEDARNVMPDER